MRGEGRIFPYTFVRDADSAFRRREGDGDEIEAVTAGCEGLVGEYFVHCELRVGVEKFRLGGRISFRNYGYINTFPGRPALQQHTVRRGAFRQTAYQYVLRVHDMLERGVDFALVAI